jgi:hypothetical protein
MPRDRYLAATESRWVDLRLSSAVLTRVRQWQNFNNEMCVIVTNYYSDVPKNVFNLIEPCASSTLPLVLLAGVNWIPNPYFLSGGLCSAHLSHRLFMIDTWDTNPSDWYSYSPSHVVINEKGAQRLRWGMKSATAAWRRGSQPAAANLVINMSRWFATDFLVRD